MKQKRRKKLEDRKRKMEWRVWKKEVVTFLQSHTLLELEFCNLFCLINVVLPVAENGCE